MCISLLCLQLALAGCPHPDSSSTDTVATPTASPAGGTYAAPVSVALSCVTGGAAIYYTLDNSTPTTGSNSYASAIEIAATATLKAIAVKDGMNNSAVMTEEYTIDDPNTVAIPTADPQGGTFDELVSVTLSCGTDGADIYYTLDGNTPTTGSVLYTDAININTTTTIKAIAVLDGMNNSPIMSETYTITGDSDAVFNIAALGTNGPAAVLVIPEAPGAKATLVINGDPSDYSSVTIGSLNSFITQNLTGRAVDVELSSTGMADISLAYVHYIREALTAQGVNATDIAVIE